MGHKIDEKGSQRHFSLAFSASAAGAEKQRQSLLLANSLAFLSTGPVRGLSIWSMSIRK